MRLIDGLKQKGQPFEIPDSSRDDLPHFFVEMGYKVGVEIGVYKGEFSEKLCRAGLNLYAIDPWLAYTGYGNPKDQAKFDLQYQETRQLLAPYPNCNLVRKTSMDAATDFPDGSLDFVYIDANHEFRYIAEDLSEWTKKVKPSGIVSGHDYFFVKTRPGRENWHVAQVLNAYLAAYNIPNWYLIGSKNAKVGEKRDKWRSWMFVKSR
jgi:SAM-dependent methyltransferase